MLLSFNADITILDTHGTTIFHVISSLVCL